jgi:hypothetical protein
VVLPADGHVHSEWSYDAPGGSMERTCARAVAMGLPAVAFTEHADYTPWTVPGSGISAGQALSALATLEGTLTPRSWISTHTWSACSDAGKGFLTCASSAGSNWANHTGTALQSQGC